MKYSAFISYNHQDRRWATWLHRALESYSVPQRLRGGSAVYGQIERRLRPVFRDRDELAASADLGQAVKTALAESAALIVVCSPGAVRSRWVSEEIRIYSAMGRRDRIFCVIVAGEPHARDLQLEAFPAPLREEVGVEPVAVDARPGQDGRTAVKLKLIAGILGVSFDELRRREQARRQRRLIAAASLSTIGFLLTSGLAAFALMSRAEAVRQRDIARQRTLTAERTVSFVKSLFEVSDPSEARGASITAREVLDRGAAQIATTLNDEPEVRAELGTTLGEVYGSLGLLQKSDATLRWALGLQHDDASVRARQFAALGDSQRRLGLYDEALATYETAIRLLRGSGKARADLLPRVLSGVGEAHTALGNDREADRALREALRLDRAMFGESHPDLARDLAALGLNEFYSGRYASAQSYTERALAIRRATEGEKSPSVSDDLNTLGSIAYMQGRSDVAEAHFRSRLAVDEAVLGAEHPDVATTLNNIARIMIERRAFSQAEPLLRRAIRIVSEERGQTHDDLAFFYSNLGLVEAGRGRLEAAEAHMTQALSIARAHDHRTLGPTLTDLADISCRRGRSDDGLRLLAEAGPIVSETYPDDPWRTAWVDSVKGECLLRVGRQREARALIVPSARVLAERWPAESLFAHEAARRLRAIR